MDTSAIACLAKQLLHIMKYSVQYNWVHSLKKDITDLSKQVPFVWSDYAQITTVILRVQDTS